jgi:hypothetical protein
MSSYALTSENRWEMKTFGNLILIHALVVILWLTHDKLANLCSNRQQESRKSPFNSPEALYL